MRGTRAPNSGVACVDLAEAGVLFGVSVQESLAANAGKALRDDQWFKVSTMWGPKVIRCYEFVYRPDEYYS